MSNSDHSLPRKLARRHRINREEVDSVGWPHPRPARDPRLVCLHLAFIWTSTIQIIKGPPPTSVQNISFGYPATVVFSVLLIICCLMVLYAAYCKSQYVSFGVEMAGCLGFTGVFAIYAAGAIVGINEWYATNVAALAIMLFLGNTWRGVKLARRIW